MRSRGGNWPRCAEFGVGARGGLAHLGLERAKLRDQREMRGAIGAERLAFDDDVRRDDRHGVPLFAAPAGICAEVL